MPETEIGSDFHFFLNGVLDDYSEEWRAYYPPGRRFYFASGRAALRALVRVLGLNPSTPVLLPAYGCPDILIAFREVGAQIIYYPVDESLRVRVEDIKKKCPRKAHMLLLIHYFGFPQPETAEIVSFCRSRGIPVLEDLVQASLTTSEGMPLGRFADFTINSFRKIVPMPDGSLMTVANDRNAGLVERTRSVHAFMFGAARTFAMALKRANEKQPSAQTKRLSKYWFHLSEDYLVRDREPAMMSPLSKLLLSRIDPNEVVRARRQNYLILLNALQGQDVVKPLFPVLPEGTCPLGFPVTTNARGGLIDALTTERIYPPVHWTLDPSVTAKVFPEARRLSRKILTLPCDQRYGMADMRRIADVTLAFARGDKD